MNQKSHELLQQLLRTIWFDTIDLTELAAHVITFLETESSFCWKFLISFYHFCDDVVGTTRSTKFIQIFKKPFANNLTNVINNCGVHYES